MSGSSIIEQAVYTSARSARGAGYHLTAASPGVSEADRKELAIWSPSHEGLLPDIPEQRSVNFFRLSSGTLCISRTVQDGEDYSQRGAARLATNILLVPEELLARFSMDPFAVLRGVELSGRMAPTGELDSPHLAPIPLIGRASAVNEPLLNQLLSEIGPAKLGIAIDCLLHRCPVAITGPVSPERIMMAIWQCLPVPCRDEFSFSTGLQYAPRRPFDIVALPSDAVARRRLVRRYQINVIDVEDLQAARIAPGGWANHVATTLARHGVAALAEQLSTQQPELQAKDLPGLAAKLAKIQNSFAGPPGKPPVNLERDANLIVAHAHGPHRHHQQSPAVSETIVSSHALDVPAPMLEKLETLDDMVFDSIAGKPGLIAQLEELWAKVLAELPGDLVEESREHYLLHAMQCWEHFVAEGRSPERAVAALDVLAIISDQHPH